MNRSMSCRARIAVTLRTTASATMAATLLAIAPAVLAAPQRVFVASYGNDTNPCSRVQPCRTFATAVAVVATGGEVMVVDTAEYGAVSIARSLSIVAPDDVVATVTTTDAVGVDITPPAGASVSIRGLRVRVNAGPNPLPPWTAGIHVHGAMDAVVTIAGVTASSRIGPALYVECGGVRVSDSAFRQSRLGVVVGDIRNLPRCNAVFSDVQIDGNDGGIAVNGDVSVEISGASIVGNGGYGVSVQSHITTTQVQVSSSMLAHNTGDGIYVLMWEDCGDDYAYAWAGFSSNSVVGNGGDGAWIRNEACIVGAAMTFVGNLIASNGGGVVARNVPRALFGANTLSDNVGPGIVQEGPLTVYTRGDNAILQPVPFSGTLTSIPAY